VPPSLPSVEALRLQREEWWQNYKKGDWYDAREVVALTELLALDLLNASSGWMATAMKRWKKLTPQGWGTIGSEERRVFVAAVYERLDTLKAATAPAAAGNHSWEEERSPEEGEVEDDEVEGDGRSEVEVDEMKGEELLTGCDVETDGDTPPPSRPPARIPSTPTSARRSSRKSTSVRRSIITDPDDAVTDAEVLLVELLLTLPREQRPARLKKLSKSAKALYRRLVTPQAQEATDPATTTVLPPTDGQPASATPAITPADIAAALRSLPQLSASTQPSRRPRLQFQPAPSPSTLTAGATTDTSAPYYHRDRPRSSHLEEDGDLDFDSKQPHHPTTSSDTAALTDLLIDMGVPEVLTSISVSEQKLPRMVHNQSIHSYWQAQLQSRTPDPLYYEGLVLSLLLDYSDDTQVWRELAARRLYTLWLVHNGSQWSEAQAWLPMSTGNVSVVEQRAMRQYQALSRPAFPRPTSDRYTPSYAPPSYNYSSRSSNTVSHRPRRVGGREYSRERGERSSSRSRRSDSRGRQGDDADYRSDGPAYRNGSNNNNSRGNNRGNTKRRGAGASAARASSGAGEQ
jgi:hypothetical protein